MHINDNITILSDNIAYAVTKAPILKVVSVRPLNDFRLWARFNNGEARIFDFKPLLSAPAFAPLSNPGVFNSVYVDYGMPVWMDGDIDIAPETLYEKGIPQTEVSC